MHACQCAGWDKKAKRPERQNAMNSTETAALLFAEARKIKIAGSGRTNAAPKMDAREIVECLPPLAINAEGGKFTEYLHGLMSQQWQEVQETYERRQQNPAIDEQYREVRCGLAPEFAVSLSQKFAGACYPAARLTEAAMMNAETAEKLGEAVDAFKCWVEHVAEIATECLPFAEATTRRVQVYQPGAGWIVAEQKTTRASFKKWGFPLNAKESFLEFIR